MPMKMDEWTWDFDQVTVEMWYSHKSHDGRDRLAYRLLDEGKVIFEGDEFGPSPSFAWDSDDSVMALLSFLTLQPGDTDEEYFQDYTPEQLEWIAGDSAEELRMRKYDLEYPDDAKEDAR